MKSLLLSALFFFTATWLHAQQPGTLDPSFGDKGILVDPAPLKVIPEPVKATAGGRILIGTAGPYGSFPSTFKIDALLPDGSPDLSFGEEGSAHVGFNVPAGGNSASISSLALLPGGKILAAGGLSLLEDNLAFARFNADGSLDSSFGTNGTAIGSTGYDFAFLSTVVLQPDGKFLIGGAVLTNSTQGVFDLFTARYLPNGLKDKSYGDNGIVITTTGGNISSMAVQEDGKIIAAGYHGFARANAVFHIERYNADGSYDKTYGNGGIVETKLGLSADISSVVLQNDGKLVATGQSNGGFSLLTVARYNVDGSLDNSFGEGGIVTTPFPQYYGNGRQVFLTGEKKDKIVVAGISTTPSVDDGSYVLVGYNADGSLDTEFGEGGTQMTRVNDNDYLYSADL